VLPRLSVLVRDFELDYPAGITSADEYLEHLLRREECVDPRFPLSTSTIGDNEMRSKILACFPLRNCYTLPHPAHGEGVKGRVSELGTAGGRPSIDFERAIRDVREVRGWCQEFLRAGSGVLVVPRAV
jgi:hypothetical protein